MEDLQLIIYIIFGIIYLIFGALKKRRKQQTEGPPPLFEEEELERPVRHASTAVPEPHAPGSLEELLERYDQAAQRAKGRASEKVETMQEQVDDEFVPVAPRQHEIRNMEAEAVEQMQRTEHLKTLQEELPADARAEVLRQKEVRPTKPVIGTGPKLRKERPRYNPYEKQRKQARLLEQIRNMARSKKALQQAILVTEILNRKHF